MKIALISPLPPPEGGIATWTKGAVSYFTENQIQCEIVNSAVIGRRKYQITSAISIYDELSRTRGIIRRLSTVLGTFHPDILHINTSCGRFGIYRDYICMQIARRRHIPCVLHCHCNVSDQLRSFSAKIIFSQMVQMAKAVLVLNKPSLQYVDLHSGRSPMLIPNFVEAEQAHVSDKMIRKNIQKILYVGHVQRSKGCFEIIEAAKHFPQISFTLVGPVSNEVKVSRLPENVTLAGQTEHSCVKEYMDDADVFLFPSYTEGFSISLLEAMQSGLPVIASGVGSNVDMLEDKGGVIVPVQDVQSIIDAITLLNNPNIREGMSLWNRDRVATCYSRISVMKKLVELYRNLSA